MSNKDSSTTQSYLDQAKGFAKQAIGAVTGNDSTQAEGQMKEAEGDSKYEASHTVANIGPLSADPNTGAVAQHNKDRSVGEWDRTVGSAREAVGNVVGSEDLRRSGAQQNAAGEEEEAKGQLKDLSEGIEDRAKGTLGSIGAAVKGDHEEEEYRDMHDEGKVRQRGAEADILKKQGE